MDYGVALDDSAAGWRRYLRELTLKAEIEAKELQKADRVMCRGWCIGGTDFKQALAMDLSEQKPSLRMQHDALADFNQSDWQRRLERCLIALGMADVEPTSSIKSAPWKLAVASKLKRECSVTKVVKRCGGEKVSLFNIQFARLGCYCLSRSDGPAGTH